MSFSKTVSVFAALASIFAAGATGWKLANENQSNTPNLEEKVQQLEKQLEESKQPQVLSQPVTLPTTQVAPPTQLPPTPPPPVNQETQP